MNAPAGRNRRTRPVGLTWPTLCYAGLLTARVFKQDSRLNVIPVDLTVLFALLVLWFSFLAVVRKPDLLNARSRELLMIIALFASFALGVLGAVPSTYASQKIIGIYSFGLIAALAPFFLIRTVEQRRAFFNAVITVGIVLGLETVMLSTFGFSTLTDERVEAFGGIPIWSGRLAGAGLLILTVRLLFHRMSMIPVAAVAIVLGIGLAASGSRGPLVGLLLALLGITLYVWRRLPFLRAVVRSALPVIGFITVVVAFAVPQQSIDRILYVVDEGAGLSEQIRFDLYGAAVDAIARNPLGVSWGSFDEVVAEYDLQALSRFDIGEGIYPHNLLLEVLVEAGWLPGLILLGVLGIVLVRLMAAEPSDDVLTVLALFLFYIVNASFSGDINANRWIPALIGMILAGFDPAPNQLPVHPPRRRGL